MFIIEDVVRVLPSGKCDFIDKKGSKKEKGDRYLHWLILLKNKFVGEDYIFSLSFICFFRRKLMSITYIPS